MKSTTKMAIGGGIALVLVVAVAAVLFVRGMVGTSEAAHPPCDQLPAAAEVTRALAEHRALAEEITALGKGVGVGAYNPCSEKEDRGLIRVTYGSDSEQRAIQDLISTRDGFGVPLYVVES
ncbi:hypothetical protein [Streptomyces sp. NPDC057552]|uniref:hypothetical protein n=1 Tax=Streptomyces sp. NPDC057552 TaxID=3350537 RepID=UPI00368110B2